MQSQIQIIFRLTFFFYRNEEYSHYVLHPVNSFHLLERSVFIAKWVSKIKQTISINIDLNSQYINDDFQRAHHGIADLLELVGMHPKQLSEGIISYEGLGRIYKSNSPLTSSNLMNIAMEAQNDSYIHGYVEWLNMALEKYLQESGKNDHVPLDLLYVFKSIEVTGFIELHQLINEDPNFQNQN